MSKPEHEHDDSYPPPVILGEEYIDLSSLLGIDEFDLVMRAVEGVMKQSPIQCNHCRDVIIARLQKALGAVVEPKAMGFRWAPHPPGRSSW